MSLLEVVILAFAVARITRLITTDSIFDGPRDWVLSRWPADDTVFGDSEVTNGKLSTGVEVFREVDGWFATYPKKWSEVITCNWCASVWVAIIVWLVYLVYPVTVTVLAPLALAQAAGLLLDRN